MCCRDCVTHATDRIHCFRCTEVERAKNLSKQPASTSHLFSFQATNCIELGLAALQESRNIDHFLRRIRRDSFGRKTQSCLSYPGTPCPGRLQNSQTPYRAVRWAYRRRG